MGWGTESSVFLFSLGNPGLGAGLDDSWPLAPVLAPRVGPQGAWLT